MPTSRMIKIVKITFHEDLAIFKKFLLANKPIYAY